MSRKVPLPAVYTTGAAGGGGTFLATCVAVLAGCVVGAATSGVFAGTSRSAAPDSGWAIVRLRAVLSAPGLFASSPLAQASNAAVATAAARIFMGRSSLTFQEVAA